MNETGVSVPVRNAEGPDAAASTRVPWPVWVIAAAFVALELAVSARYGFLQDELYFIEAGRHLALGYVDQPPMMPLLDKTTDFLGLNPTAVRIIPALAGAAIIVLASRFAALFGGGRFSQVLAALAVAGAPVLLGAMHIANTTPLELLAWTVTIYCVATALLRDKPRWWIGAGIAAGLGLEDNNLLVLLLICLVIGIACTMHRPVLRTPWPWIGAAIAAVLFAPDIYWQATHGWPQFAMASALHQENNSVADYIGGPLVQLFYVGLLVSPLLFAGFIRLWRAPELRFLAIVTGLTVLYVLAWIPGRPYYTDGLTAMVLAAGSVAAERWVARARRARLRQGILVGAALIGAALIVPYTLPVVPAADVHTLPKTVQQSSGVGDEIGWPQLAHAIAAQDAALKRAGTPPTSIFTGYYAEAAALNVLGTGYHLPPVLSGHNAYWTWGPGSASDRRVLVVDALGMVRRYFASCRIVATYHAPYGVRNDWTGIPIGVCTGPVAGWHALWPHLRHYG